VKNKKLPVVFLIVLCFFVNVVSVFALAPRFGIDESNTRQIKDSFTETGFPFREVLTQKLGG
jgi:hypothetical protein